MRPVAVFMDGFDKLCVRAAFEQKDACKAIPGARWHKDLKVWWYPPTPMAARTIADTFQAATTWDPESKALLLEADAILAAAVHKTAEVLPPIPHTMTEPWAHQLKAYHFAKGLHAVMLALDMGTGKTKCAIDLIVNRNLRRILIVCPKSVVTVWPAEFRRHSAVDFTVCPLASGAVTDRTKQATKAFALAVAREEPIAIVVNYEAVWTRGMAEWVMGTHWDAVILDESHRIKQPGGKASMFFSRLGDKVPVRLCLTGTPMAHSPLDLYAQYRFLDKGIFGTSFTVFRARYALLQPVGGQAHPAAQKVIGFQNQAELHEKMYSIAYRVKSEDVQSLPEVVDTIRHAVLGPHARKVYEVLKDEFTADFGAGIVTAGNALTRLLRLQQIASGWAKQDDNITTGQEGALVQIDDEKQKLLLDTLEDLSHAEPIVVFCRFRHDLEAVHTVAAALGRGSLELSGTRNDLPEWQSGPAPILAVQIKSGGVGIDLTRARYAVYFSLGFSLGDYLQSRKRLHRPGQGRTVTNIHLIARETVDELIYQAIEARQDVVEAILAQSARL
jgi:SNF2 family DNA or RNA helicase